MKSIIVIAHDIRSCHNVGALFRTCEGLGVAKLYLTGYTPYPVMSGDDRLPHIGQKQQSQIDKTALGATDMLPWVKKDINDALSELISSGYTVAALEQPGAKLNTYKVPDKIALLIGREVEGIEPSLLARCNNTLEIPMFGSKESFNVVEATSMALFYFRFFGVEYSYAL